MTKFVMIFVILGLVLCGCTTTYIDKDTIEIKKSFDRTVYYKGIFILKKGKYEDDMVKIGSPFPYIFKHLINGIKSSILETPLFNKIIDMSKPEYSGENDPEALEMLVISDMFLSKAPIERKYTGDYEAGMRIGCIIRTVGKSGKIIYYRLYETTHSSSGFKGSPYFLCIKRVLKEMLNDIANGSFDDPSYISINLDPVRLEIPIE